MSHDDHAVDNNPRKELMLAGVALAMFLGIAGLIGISAFLRPAAPKAVAPVAAAPAPAADAAAQ